MLKMKVMISPFSRNLMNNKQNPKNYPYWEVVVKELRGAGCEVVQVGVTGEAPIGADDFFVNLSLDRILDIAKECNAWASIDNFFPHLMNTIPKAGVVIYSLSDPRIFGYPYNINLLKSEVYLRPDQFNIWEAVEYNKEAFVGPECVIRAIRSLSEK